MEQRKTRPYPYPVTLLFSANAERRWYERFLHPDFGHIDILALQDDIGMLLEPYGGTLRMTAMDREIALKLLWSWRGPMVSMVPDLSPIGHGPWEPASCVALAKSVVGCNNRRVWTPRQLYQWCLDNGGQCLGK